MSSEARRSLEPSVRQTLIDVLRQLEYLKRQVKALLDK